MTSSILKFSVVLQKYRTPVLTVSCVGVFAANMFYHTFPDLSYRKLYQAWHKGRPVALSDKLQELFQQVRVPWLPAGAHVGLPANFNSSTPQDARGITDRSVFINGQAVAWDSEAGGALRDSLVLSPAAQRFAVAREVARLDIGGPVVSAAVAPACLGSVWVYSTVVKQMLGLHGGPALFRGAANLAALGLGAVSYLLTSDAISQWVDYSSDRRAAAVSPDYTRGGVEFYDKLLSRNRTLRTLMGPKGEEMYAASGNLN
ncbi:hypothetical protein CRUP_033808 [Coryphaenoides rupestris]|nr:hypothetical protein CRUP_033808 [Coryphaenoides rupestris]